MMRHQLLPNKTKVRLYQPFTLLQKTLYQPFITSKMERFGFKSGCVMRFGFKSGCVVRVENDKMHCQL